MYEVETEIYPGYPKSEERSEESDNYRNESYHKSVKTKDVKSKLTVQRNRK